MKSVKNGDIVIIGGGIGGLTMALSLHRRGIPCRMFEAERLEVVNRIVLTNRDQPPDFIIETVDNLTGGRRSSV